MLIWSFIAIVNLNIFFFMDNIKKKKFSSWDRKKIKEVSNWEKELPECHNLNACFSFDLYLMSTVPKTEPFCLGNRNCAKAVMVVTKVESSKYLLVPILVLYAGERTLATACTGSECQAHRRCKHFSKLPFR